MKIEDAYNLKIPEQFGVDEDYGCADSDCFYEVCSQLTSHDDISFGITKFVIFPTEDPDYVVKIPFNGMFFYRDDIQASDFDYFYHEDYCAIELDLYNEAYERGLEKLFTDMIFGGHTKDGTPFYIAERVKSFSFNESSDHRPPSDDSRRKNKELRDDWEGTYLPYNWMLMAIEYYGEQKVRDLIELLDSFGIDDFHEGNVGMREDGSPCLLDFGGYNEDF